MNSHGVGDGVECRTWLLYSVRLTGKPTIGCMATTVEIPKRALFKAAEVCAIAKVQPYVLRSWETEFPALGTAKGDGRVYRRSDVEMVLEIRHLVYEEGLTLGAARRKLGTRENNEPVDGEPTIDDLLGQDARERIVEVRRGLRSILELLSTNGDPEGGLFDGVTSLEKVSKEDGHGRLGKVRNAGKRRAARAPKRKRRLS